MPASNTKIKKICEWCGTRFEAQKISTKYCSHRCANLAYKKREREKNIKATEENTQNRIEERLECRWLVRIVESGLELEVYEDELISEF